MNTTWRIPKTMSASSVSYCGHPLYPALFYQGRNAYPSQPTKRHIGKRRPVAKRRHSHCWRKARYGHWNGNGNCCTWWQLRRQRRHETWTALDFQLGFATRAMVRLLKLFLFALAAMTAHGAHDWRIFVFFVTYVFNLDLGACACAGKARLDRSLGIATRKHQNVDLDLHFAFRAHLFFHSCPFFRCRDRQALAWRTILYFRSQNGAPICV